MASLVARRNELRSELTALHHKAKATRSALMLLDSYLAPVCDYMDEQDLFGRTGGRYIQSVEDYPTVDDVNDLIKQVSELRHELMNVNESLARMGV